MRGEVRFALRLRQRASRFLKVDGKRFNSALIDITPLALIVEGVNACLSPAVLCTRIVLHTSSNYGWGVPQIGANHNGYGQCVEDS